MKSQSKPQSARPVRPARRDASRASSPSIEAVWEGFVEFLRDRGARITRARRIVLEAVAGRDDHFRADDLAVDLSRGVDRVSRGTVYRTLSLMAEAGVVREVRDSDVHAHYEYSHRREHHEHMVCRRCGRFIEFADPRIEALIEQACRRADFGQQSHRVEVFGICGACRAAGDGDA